MPTPDSIADFVLLALIERSKHIVARPIPIRIAMGPESAIPTTMVCVKLIDAELLR
jgi:hypothetical protein